MAGRGVRHYGTDLQRVNASKVARSWSGSIVSAALTDSGAQYVHERGKRRLTIAATDTMFVEDSMQPSGADHKAQRITRRDFGSAS